MTEKAISPLRRRLIEDMTIRRLSPKTHYQYIRHVKKFADFLGRSADKATAEHGIFPPTDPIASGSRTAGIGGNLPRSSITGVTAGQRRWTKPLPR